MTTAPISRCPHCGTRITWNEDYPQRPFCSERCKLLDLGAWFGEEHRIPGAPDQSRDNPGSEGGQD